MKKSISHFITPRNAQLLSRIFLANALMSNEGVGFAWKLYSNVHSLSDPTSSEYGEDGVKNSLQDYLRYFLQLIESLRSSGYNPQDSRPITVTDNNVVIDGAHRLAILHCLGVSEVDVELAEDSGESGLSIQRLRDSGLQEKYVEALSALCILRSECVNALVLFGFDKNTSSQLLKQLPQSELFHTYKLEFKLNELGRRRLTQACYGSADWFNEDLRESMTQERFLGKSNSVTILFFPKDAEYVTSVKLRLRKLVNGFERRIHSTDSTEEAIRLLTFASRSGRHWAENAPLDSEAKFLRERGGPLPHRGFSYREESLFLSGSTLLELYGIGFAKDRDIIQKGVLSKNPRIVPSGHFKFLESLGIDPEDFMQDPSLHFWLEGDLIISLTAALQLYSRQIRDDGKYEKLQSLIAFERSGSSSKPVVTSRIRKYTIIARILLSRIYEALLRALPTSIQDRARKFARKLARKLPFDI